MLQFVGNTVKHFSKNIATAKINFLYPGTYKHCTTVSICWRSMSTEREFTVYISAHEYKQICAWVLKHGNSETGGDLFGLWSGERSAVVQFVLGPGRECRRGVHSFYQDVSYMEKAGSYLTHQEGLCHIGEWHSHHTIGLKRPSGGDERTVWSNMPTYGLKRFLLFIANIESSRHEVSIGCFLFEFGSGSNRKQLPVLQGSFVLMPSESSFRLKCQPLESGRDQIEHCEDSVRYLEDRAESLNTPADVSQLEVKTAAKHAMRPVVEDHRLKKSVTNEKYENRSFAKNRDGQEEEEDMPKEERSAQVEETPEIDGTSSTKDEPTCPMCTVL